MASCAACSINQSDAPPGALPSQHCTPGARIDPERRYALPVQNITAASLPGWERSLLIPFWPPEATIALCTACSTNKGDAPPGGLPSHYCSPGARLDPELRYAQPVPKLLRQPRSLTGGGPLLCPTKPPEASMALCGLCSTTQSNALPGALPSHPCTPGTRLDPEPH